MTGLTPTEFPGISRSFGARYTPAMRRDEQPSNRAPRLLACAATFASVLAGPGCVGSDRRASSIDERVEFVDDAAMTVHPEEYAAVFERARGALRDAGFSIE